jgi:glycosyltransferase involved in cell wall biosynthesis
MKIALAHDFFSVYGGAERVVEALHEVWPEAPIFTAFVDKQGLGKHWQRFTDWDIRTSWAQKIPGIRKLHSPLRLLAKKMFESFDVSEYDVVVASSNMYMAKAIGRKDKKRPLIICYCHTPPRSLYGYPTARHWQRYWWGKVVGSLMSFFMRIQDFETAQKVDFFVANSKETQRRIKKFYRRDSKVIYPPAPQFQSLGPVAKGDYYLVVSRLIYAKKVDLAVKACSRLKLRLKVVGVGRDEKELKQMAGAGVEFLGEVGDKALAQLYAGCKAVIFPAIQEDFGLVPVEAMSLGKPVIALRGGGVEESIIEGETGFFFDEPKEESLVKILKKFEAGQLPKIKPMACLAQAKKFSQARFKREIKEFVYARVT